MFSGPLPDSGEERSSEIDRPSPRDGARECGLLEEPRGIDLRRIELREQIGAPGRPPLGEVGSHFGDDLAALVGVERR